MIEQNYLMIGCEGRSWSLKLGKTLSPLSELEKDPNCKDPHPQIFQKLAAKEWNQNEDRRYEQSFFGYDIDNHFVFEQENDYIYYLAHSIKMLGVDLEHLPMSCDINPSQKQVIRSQNPQSTYLYTRRKSFIHCYAKPVWIRKQTECIIVYESEQIDGREVSRFHCMTMTGQIYITISNIDESGKDFQRAVSFLKEKMKKIYRVILISNATQETISLDLYQKIKQFVEQVILFAHKEPFQGKMSKLQDFCVKKIGNYSMHINVCRYPYSLTISQGSIPAGVIKQYCVQLLRKYRKIKSTIYMSLFSRTVHVLKELLRINELANRLFAFYYNYLSLQNDKQSDKIKLQFGTSFQSIHNAVLIQFFKGKEQFVKNKITNQMKENHHYPAILESCKFCTVCLVKYQTMRTQKHTTPNLIKKGRIIEKRIIRRRLRTISQESQEISVSRGKSLSKDKSIEEEDRIPLPRKCKTKYKCVGCTSSFERDIPLCVTCFKEFHTRMNKYIPHIQNRHLKMAKEAIKIKMNSKEVPVNKLSGKSSQNSDSSVKQEDHNSPSTNLVSNNQNRRQWENSIENQEMYHMRAMEKIHANQQMMASMLKTAFSHYQTVKNQQRSQAPSEHQFVIPTMFFGQISTVPFYFGVSDIQMRSTSPASNISHQNQREDNLSSHQENDQ